MDIRYICWAGYDLLGQVTTMQPSAPKIDGEKISYGMEADYAGPETSKTITAKVEDEAPTVKGKYPAPSVKAADPDLRPFPRPSNTL